MYKYYTHLNSQLVGPWRKPRFIVLHWYGAPGQTSDVHGTAQYLANAVHASVHYVTAAGVVYCLTDPDNAAYAQGDGANGEGNLYGISIENNPHCTPEDRETTAQLIADIRKTYGPLPLRIHKHFTATQCPGVWEQHVGWLDARANEINAGKPAGASPAPAPAPKPPAPAPAAPQPQNGVWELPITAKVANVRTSPEVRPDNIAKDWKNGLKEGAPLAVVGYVRGQDPFDDGVRDDAWLKTISGLYVWANNVNNNIIAGLPFLGDMTPPPPAPKPVEATRIVTNAVAWVRTSPEVRPDNIAKDWKNGIKERAPLAVVGYVAGQDPYGTDDNAWYVTKSGLYVWANAAGNNLSGLPKLN